MKQLILVGMLALSLNAMAGNNGNNGNNNGPTFGGNTSSNSTAVGLGVGVGIGQGGNSASSSNATGGNAVAVGGSVNNNVKNNVDNTNVNSNVSSNKNSNNNVSKNTNSNSNASSNSNNSGASVNVEATDGSDYAPPVYAPSLTTGICMGSVSGGLSAPGFGISGGGTTIDEEYQLRYNSIRLEQLGMKDAGVLIMCQVETAKLALEQSGFLCPVVEDSKSSNSTATGTKPMWER
jgi:hypothetical protein